MECTVVGGEWYDSNLQTTTRTTTDLQGGRGEGWNAVVGGDRGRRSCRSEPEGGRFFGGSSSEEDDPEENILPMVACVCV